MIDVLFLLLPGSLILDWAGPAEALRTANSLLRRQGKAAPFALRYAGRKRVHTADDIMARVTAERLVQHLQRCGYVLMRSPTATPPSTSGHKHPHEE